MMDITSLGLTLRRLYREPSDIKITYNFLNMYHASICVAISNDAKMAVAKRIEEKKDVRNWNRTSGSSGVFLHNEVI